MASHQSFERFEFDMIFDGRCQTCCKVRLGTTSAVTEDVRDEEATFIFMTSLDGKPAELQSCRKKRKTRKEELR